MAVSPTGAVNRAGNVLCLQVKHLRKVLEQRKTAYRIEYIRQRRTQVYLDAKHHFTFISVTGKTAAAAAAADAVAYFTRSAFETSSVAFLSPHLVHRIRGLMLLFLFLGRQTSREALAFILIKQDFFPPHFLFFFLFSTVMIPILLNMQDWRRDSL